MSFSYANLLDLTLLAVLLITVIHYVRRGFLAGILELVGSLASLALAWFVSGKASPAVFSGFFKSGLIEKTAQTIQQQGTVNLNTILESLSGVLPQEFVNRIVNSASSTLDSAAPDVAQQVVEKIVEPLVVPIITVVVFFATFALCRLLITFLVSALTNVNRVPLVGGANRLLGVLLGAAGGVLNVLLLLCFLWGAVAITSGKLTWLNDTTLSGSWFYSLFSQYNPFL